MKILITCEHALNLLSDTENIHEQTSVISDYINFYTDLCIQVIKEKFYQNDKLWLTADIYDLSSVPIDELQNIEK